MKNISPKKIWRTGAVQIHVNTPPVPLIKSKNDSKVENDCVENKFCRDILRHKVGHVRILNGLIWKLQARVIIIICAKFQDDTQRISNPCSQCKSPVPTYFAMCKGTMPVLYFV